MYKLTYNDELLYSPIADEAIYDASLTRQSVNAYDYLEFRMPPEHPLLGKVAVKDGRVKLYSNGKILFDGYIEEIEEGVEGELQITCVSCMAYLEDTLVRSYTTGKNSVPSTINGYFEWLIQQHNNNSLSAKSQFSIGINQGDLLTPENTITASSDQLPTTRDEIVNKILDSVGGYLVVRYVNNGNYLDLYADVTSVNAQIVDFGVNLVDFTRTTDAKNIYTAIRPKGNDNLTISGIANGCSTGDSDMVKSGDVIYSKSAVNRYGYREFSWSCTTATNASQLMAAAVVQLRKIKEPALTIEATAVDMELVDGSEHLSCGQAVRVRSTASGIDEYLIVQGMSLDLQNPENTLFTLGAGTDSLTGNQSNKLKNLNASVNSQADAVGALDEEVKNAAQNAADATASANQALKEVTDKSKVFTSQPVPPYSQGDLWAQGSNGDLMMCLIPKEAGEKYDPDDWVKATEYSAAKDEYDRLQAEAEELRKKLEALENGLKGIDDAENVTQNAAYLVAAAAAAAAEAAKKATESLDKINSDISNIKDAADKTSGTLDEVSDALSDIKGKVESVQDDVETAKADIASVPAKIEAVRDEMRGETESVKTTLEADYSKKSEVDAIEAALKSEIEASASEIRQTLTADYATNTALTEVKDKLTSQIIQTADSITSRVDSLYESQYKLDATREMLDAAYSDVVAAKAIAQIAASNLDDAKRYLEEAQTAAAEALDAKANAQEAMDRAEAALNEAAEQYLLASDAYQGLLNNDQATPEQLAQAKEKLDNIQKIYNAAREDAAKAAAENAKAGIMSEACQTAVESAKQALAQVQANVEAADKAVQAAKDAADKAQAAVDALTDVVAQQGTEISQNKEQIALRATKTEAQAYATTAQEAAKTYSDAQLKVQADRIDTTITEVTNLTERTSSVEQTNSIFQVKIDSLQKQVLGGTNLIRSGTVVERNIVGDGGLDDCDDHESPYLSSDFIEISDGKVAILQTWREDMECDALMHYIVFYDTAKLYIGGYDETLYADEHVTVTSEIPANAKYMRASFPKQAPKYKLEIGERPTGWSVNPEDLQEALDNAATSTDVDNLQTTVDAIAGELTGLQGGLNDKIQDIVSSQLNFTNEAFEVRFENYQQELDAITGELKNTIGEINNYLRYDSDGNLRLGTKPVEGQQNFELIINKNSINFVLDNAKVAYITNDKLYINHADIQKTLGIGGFLWNQRPNGSMNLTWRGLPMHTMENDTPWFDAPANDNIEIPPEAEEPPASDETVPDKPEVEVPPERPLPPETDEEIPLPPDEDEEPAWWLQSPLNHYNMGIDWNTLDFPEGWCETPDWCRPITQTGGSTYIDMSDTWIDPNTGQLWNLPVMTMDLDIITGWDVGTEFGMSMGCPEGLAYVRGGFYPTVKQNGKVMLSNAKEYNGYALPIIWYAQALKAAGVYDSWNSGWGEYILNGGGVDGS